MEILEKQQQQQLHMQIIDPYRAVVVAILAVCALTMMTSTAISVVKWRQERRKLPGPSRSPPLLIGSLMEMIRDPDGFWTRQFEYDKNGLSWNAIAGYHMVFSADPQATHEILNLSNGEHFQMALHPNAHIILGSSNIAFMHGPKHKALRASFLPLFTRRSLSMYLDIQQDVIEKHMNSWTQYEGPPQEMRELCRDLNLEVSTLVFLGGHLPDNERASAAAELLAMTEAFIAVPIMLPGTTLWRGWRQRHSLVRRLRRCVNSAFDKVRGVGPYWGGVPEEGRVPDCLLDLWVQRVAEDVEAAKREGRKAPAYARPTKLATTMMDFLFASQDASTASITWAFAMMKDHPDVLMKVRIEQDKLRKSGGRIDYDMLESMEYTRQVVKELLRHRPPATMVPQVAKRDVKLSEESGGHIIRRGTLVMPSLLAASSHMPRSEVFDPDRMGPEERMDQRFRKAFVPFGYGPHKCVGYQYAINQLMTVLAVASYGYDWERHMTGRDDNKILYFSTIYPTTCVCNFSRRKRGCATVDDDEQQQQ